HQPFWLDLVQGPVPLSGLRRTIRLLQGALAGGQMKHFYPLKVASVAKNTRDAVVVTFDVPDELRDAFRFRPGQYLTLRTQLDGQELRRSYSICAAPGDRQLRVAIKRLNDGAFSSWA